MMDFIRHTILNNSFLLSAGRCIFWEEEKALILSDLHFGKTGHFRKNGIAVPQTVFKEDMQRLTAQVQYFKAEQLIIVGDLFHSHANKEMEWFLKWRTDFALLNIKLIIGNHDILGKEWYNKANISCIKHQWQT
ncbi:MAG: metallophosphoesterase, partial [Ferruginibacter sp.]